MVGHVMLDRLPDPVPEPHGPRFQAFVHFFKKVFVRGDLFGLENACLLGSTRPRPPRSGACSPSPSWHLYGFRACGARKDDDVTTVDDLIGKRLRGFVLIHGPDPEDVPRQGYFVFFDARADVDFEEFLDKLASSAVLFMSATRFELAEQVAEVVLDVRQVHLVEQHQDNLVIQAVFVARVAMALLEGLE